MRVEWRRCLVVMAGGLLILGMGGEAAAQAPRFEGFQTNTDRRSIDLSELISGGVPKDGIPAIDAPLFVKVDAAREWLSSREPVVAVVLGGKARAYPLQILTWHEVVNDRLAETPIVVTFCPLCYSAIAFRRTVAGKVIDFGVSGMLRHADLVMYDRQTESLWQQLTGEAVVGDLTGARLEALPAQIISFEQFAASYPQGEVLSRATGHARPYGRNPYVGYDDIEKRPFLYRGKIDGRLPPMARVVAVSLGGEDKAYPHALTRERRVVHDVVGDVPIVVFHADGAVSALDRATISESKEVGSTGVFEARLGGRTLRFRYEAGRFVDEQTGTTWDVTGRAVEGPWAGRRLRPVPHGDFFAFAWFAFKPDVSVYQ